MLILTRGPGEAIRIGNDIEIKFWSIDGQHARVGIEAPKHVFVHREEVYQKILARLEDEGRIAAEL